MLQNRKEDEKIRKRISQLQKEFITQKSIREHLKVNGKLVTETEILSEFDEGYEETNGHIFKLAPIILDKDIQNHRKQYKCSDLTLLNNETYDNSRDAKCKLFLADINETNEELILKFLDDGTGIKNLRDFLTMGSRSKDIDTETIGLLGQGGKLEAPLCIIYCITETKLKDGTATAVIWFFSDKKGRIVYLNSKPRGMIKTPSGTYHEVHLLKKALDDNELDEYKNNSIEDYLYTMYAHNYRSHLLEKPGEVLINGNVVVAEQFSEAEITLPFSKGNQKHAVGGELIITKEIHEECDIGIILNVWGKDVVTLDLKKDFGIDIDDEIYRRIQGVIKDNNLKPIVAPSKDDINKKLPNYQSLWNDFKRERSNEIIKMLRNAGYYTDILSGEEAFANRLNKDVRTLMNNDEGFKNKIAELKKTKGKTTTGPSGIGGNNAITNLSTGIGKITGRIIHSEDTLEKGFSATTDVDDFFKNGKESPCLLKDIDKSNIKVYIRIPGQKKMQHLIKLDKEVTGSDFTIDNVPLDMDLLVKAYTFYGNARHLSEPLGRPTKYIHLTSSNLSEKAVLPINIKQSIKIITRPDPSFEISRIGKEDEEDPDDEKCIIINETHPEYVLHKRKGEPARYVHVLTAIVYAVCSSMTGDEEFKKRRYKECLAKLLG